jgi:hypothetical protein
VAALSSFWGVKRMRWFAVAGDSETLAIASSVLGTDRYTFDQRHPRLREGRQRSPPTALVAQPAPHPVARGRSLLSQVESHLDATA